MFISLSVAIVIGGLLYAQHKHYLHLAEAAVKKDAVTLGKMLEAKIAEIDALKGKMEALLLKNGFGR